MQKVEKMIEIPESRYYLMLKSYDEVTERLHALRIAMSGRIKETEGGNSLAREYKCPTEEELGRLVDRYEEIASKGISNEEAMDLLDPPERCDWMKLLDIAEWMMPGKLKAILLAFRLGYLAGQKAAQHE